MTTDKQKIKKLEERIVKLQKEINELNGIQFELVNDLNVIPLREYAKVVDQNDKLIAKLKQYNLWTGIY